MQLYLTERLRRHTSRKICLIMPVESVTTPKDNTIIIPYLRGNCKNQVKKGMTLKQVQYRLGHSDLKTTMNIYTHITKEAKDDIGEKFANYIDF